MVEEIKETEELQEEEVKEEIKEEPETKESVIEKIGSKIKSYFSGEKEEQEETVNVPQEFYDVAAAQGWTEDEIMDFILDEGKPLYNDKELIDMIPFLKGENSAEADAISDNPTVDETKDKKVDDSQEDEKTKKLLARIEALEKAQGKQKEVEQKQELSNLVRKGAKIFDDVSKDFEGVFGTTEKLPTFPDGRIVPNSPQMKARSEVWDTALKLHGSGVDFDRAMSIAINAYKGEHLGKVIERNIIKDLKKRETKLSGKRISHESVNDKKTGPEVIKEILQKAGKV